MNWRLHSIPALALALALVFALYGAGASIAADKTHPDWPCLQKKIEEVSVTQVWDGPAIDDIKGWRDDEDVAKLVQFLVTRKHSVDEASAEIKKYAEALPATERDKRMTTVFAGLFETMSAERRTILSGIEKYNKRQKERADIVELKGKAIEELEAKASKDEAAAAELEKAQEDYEWETRIFKERNDNVPIACELPVLIDQRLFELAKSIRGLMKS